MGMIDNFEKMLVAGKDNALLRFSLGNEYCKLGQVAAAIPHLRAAVAADASYSAAWKLLGKALAESGDNEGAGEAFTRGIEAAQTKGDKQAAKEMAVFRRRLEKRN